MRGLDFSQVYQSWFPPISWFRPWKPTNWASRSFQTWRPHGSLLVLLAQHSNWRLARRFRSGVVRRGLGFHLFKTHGKLLILDTSVETHIYRLALLIQLLLSETFLSRWSSIVSGIRSNAATTRCVTRRILLELDLFLLIFSSWVAANWWSRRVFKSNSDSATVFGCFSLQTLCLLSIVCGCLFSSLVENLSFHLFALLNLLF